jgi:arylsulfatase A-like enzyme
MTARALARLLPGAGLLLAACGGESGEPGLRLLARDARGVPERVVHGDVVADGRDVKASTPAGWTVDLEPGLALSLGWRTTRPAAEASVVVRCNDEVLATRPCQAAGVQWLRLDLPARRAPGARLTLSVEGDAEGQVLCPVIGPRADKKRPDVLVLLVDTLRADALGVYRGDEPSPTPHLDAFARRSVRLECRSSATWTLPSISSLFTARAPLQHGAYESEHVLGAEAHTLAEVLAEAGYRTAAITDSVFVSRLHGLDQGFEWFEEVPREGWDLTHTLARADELLARDDGRPLFLFVHTYRVHKPYRVGLEEDAGPYDEAWAATGSRAVRKGRTNDQALIEADTYRGLYARGVEALDAELGPWLERLEAGPFLRDGLLVLTSDHGEAFGEKQQIFHRGHPYEAETRVPLLLRSARLAAGTPAGVASLVDLPRTIGAWCGVAADPGWLGEDLLAPRPSARAFSWRVGREIEGARGVEAAVVEGPRKVLASFDVGEVPGERARPRLREAYDLGDDPGEARNLATGEAWPTELLEAVREELLRRTRPEIHSTLRELDDAQREALDHLGYGGDGE